MMADLVPGRGDGADEFGMGGGVFSDEKKRGAGVVRGEQGEDARRVDGVGTVVEGEPDLAGGGGEAAVDAEEALGVGNEEVVGEDEIGDEPEGEGGDGSGAGEDERGEFAAEVEDDEKHGWRLIGEGRVEQGRFNFNREGGAANIGLEIGNVVAGTQKVCGEGV